MPELPEVETVVTDLKKRVLGRRILDVWTDWPKYFRGLSLAQFKRHVVGKNILGVTRRGKNILMELSDSHLILVHLKMTGHLLAGRWQNVDSKWVPAGNFREMRDPKNGFIRLIFFLDPAPFGKGEGQVQKKYTMLALSDMRRFAKVLCGPRDKILNSPDLKDLGPEALEISYKEFRDKFKVKRGKIKQVLMDQKFVVGIGNIYSDEILYTAKIHPLSRVEKLKEPQIKVLYLAMKKILEKGIKMRGTSSDDFRDTYGKKGNYGSVILTYQRHGEKCAQGHLIHRIKVGQRSAHFCPVCQKLVV